MKHHFTSNPFPVTETQHLIATAALNALQGDGELDENQIETFARMMVLIQKGGLGSYFANGLDWSFRSRSVHEPEQVQVEVVELNELVSNFSEAIDTARGKAASRIRWNRTRRMRQQEQELEDEIQEQQQNLIALQRQHDWLRQADHRFAA